jgi:hypothetical protein
MLHVKRRDDSVRQGPAWRVLAGPRLGRPEQPSGAERRCDVAEPGTPGRDRRRLLPRDWRARQSSPEVVHPPQRYGGRRRGSPRAPRFDVTRTGSWNASPRTHGNGRCKTHGRRTRALFRSRGGVVRGRRRRIGSRCSRQAPRRADASTLTPRRPPAGGVFCPAAPAARAGPRTRRRVTAVGWRGLPMMLGELTPAAQRLPGLDTTQVGSRIGMASRTDCRDPGATPEAVRGSARAACGLDTPSGRRRGMLYRPAEHARAAAVSTSMTIVGSPPPPMRGRRDSGPHRGYRLNATQVGSRDGGDGQNGSAAHLGPLGKRSPVVPRRRAGSAVP